MKLTDQQKVQQHLNKRIKLEDGTLVFRVSPFIIDVFLGEGFRQHSRYQRVRGRWAFSSGHRLDEKALGAVISAL